ncbi:hypothetical protein L9F63_012973, partial [Diploptera punctata]
DFRVVGRGLEACSSATFRQRLHNENKIKYEMKEQTVNKRAVSELMRLKAELQALRRKGALRSGPGWSSEESSPGGRSCARCRAELGRIMNRGAFCRACRLRVCKACREYSVRSTDWVCSVCHKH